MMSNLFFVFMFGFSYWSPEMFYFSFETVLKSVIFKENKLEV